MGYKRWHGLGLKRDIRVERAFIGRLARRLATNDSDIPAPPTVVIPSQNNTEALRLFMAVRGFSQILRSTELCFNCTLLTLNCAMKLLMALCMLHRVCKCVSINRPVNIWALSQNSEKRLLASSCLSVYQSAWNNSAPTRRILTKFYIWAFFFFENMSRKINFH